MSVQDLALFGVVKFSFARSPCECVMSKSVMLGCTKVHETFWRCVQKEENHIVALERFALPLRLPCDEGLDGNVVSPGGND
jgi:hypothetical protein